MVSAFARWDEFLNCDGCAECLLDHFECRNFLMVTIYSIHSFWNWTGLVF